MSLGVLLCCSFIRLTKAAENMRSFSTFRGKGSLILVGFFIFFWFCSSGFYCYVTRLFEFIGIHICKVSINCLPHRWSSPYYTSEVHRKEKKSVAWYSDISFLCTYLFSHDLHAIFFMYAQLLWGRKFQMRQIVKLAAVNRSLVFQFTLAYILPMVR